MIPVAEALERVTAGFAPLGCEQVALAGALGRVLAGDVASRLSHPPAAVSSMDGYAVRAADVGQPPASLELIGEAAAGSAFEGAVGAGQTARIFTGAPLPAGADAVVMQEDTTAEGTRITIHVAAPEGRFIRARGMDFKEGDVLLSAGTVLSARDIALAAAMNVPWLEVRRRPRIAILATGNELAMPGDPLRADQIISSNSLALAAYVEALGGVPINLGIARDDADSLLARLAGARRSDLLVTIGGASVGDHDLVRKILGDEGLELDFFKVAMRPGKPLIFGRLGDVPVLGLPGNPVSAGVTSVVFLKPAMAVMLGIGGDGGPPPTALLGRDLPANDGRQEYMRAVLAVDDQGNPVATPFEKQDSAMLARFAEADCLLIRPPHAPSATAGTRVEIIPLRQGTVSI